MKKQLVPDFIATDVNSAPVWEITGAEFSQAEGHTADGISIRFPRVTKVRDDKSWHEATDFERLKVLGGFLIAALIFSAGYYSAPTFFYNSKNLNCIGALSFSRL